MKNLFFLSIVLANSMAIAQEAVPKVQQKKEEAKETSTITVPPSNQPTTINNTYICQKECEPKTQPKAQPKKPKVKPKPVPKPIKPKPQPQPCPTPVCPTPVKPKPEKEIVYVDREVYQPHSLSLMLGKGPKGFYPVLEKRSDAAEYKYYRDVGYVGGLQYQYQFHENWAAGVGYLSNDTWFATGTLKWGSSK